MISPEQLRRFSIFAGLDPAFFKKLAMATEEASLKSGEWLFHEGDDAESLYLILGGTIDLKVSLDQAESRHADLTTLGVGEAVGYSAVVEPYSYSAGASVGADAKLAKVDAEKLRELLFENPEQGLILMHRVAQLIRTRLNNLSIRFVSLTT